MTRRGSTEPGHWASGQGEDAARTAGSALVRVKAARGEPLMPPAGRVPKAAAGALALATPNVRRLA